MGLNVFPVTSIAISTNSLVQFREQPLALHTALGVPPPPQPHISSLTYCGRTALKKKEMELREVFMLSWPTPNIYVLRYLHRT